MTLLIRVFHMSDDQHYDNRTKRLFCIFSLYFYKHKVSIDASHETAKKANPGGKLHIY